MSYKRYTRQDEGKIFMPVGNLRVGNEARLFENGRVTTVKIVNIVESDGIEREDEEEAEGLPC